MRFLLLLAAVNAAFAGVPATWVSHNDPAGFTVRHPPGWIVEAGASGLVRVRSADGRSFAAVQPFLAPRGVRAVAWIGSNPGPLQALLPQARLEGSRQGAARPDQAVGIFAVAGREPVRALALVSIYRGAGMLYAIAAPAATLAAQQADLVAILGTFLYRPATQTGGAAPIDLTWTQFREPTEGAYTVEIPSGWRATGSVAHVSVIDARPQVSVTSPDGAVTIQSGDPDVPMFAHPTPALLATGFTEGRWYGNGTGRQMIRRYRPGKLSAMDYVQGKIAPRCANLKIVAEADRHDWEQAIPHPPSLRLDFGEVSFTCEMNGKPIRGYRMVGTSFSGTTQAYNTWMVMSSEGYLAAEGKERLAEVVLHRMETTFAGDPRWTAAQQNVTLQVAQQNAAEYRRRIADIDKRYREYDRQWDESTRKKVELIGNRTTLVDPQTGDHYEAASGHNYYSVDPVSQRKGFASDIDELPNVDFHPLLEYRAPPVR